MSVIITFGFLAILFLVGSQLKKKIQVKRDSYNLIDLREEIKKRKEQKTKVEDDYR